MTAERVVYLVFIIIVLAWILTKFDASQKVIGSLSDAFTGGVKTLMPK